MADKQPTETALCYCCRRIRPVHERDLHGALCAVCATSVSWDAFRIAGRDPIRFLAEPNR